MGFECVLVLLVWEWRRSICCKSCKADSQGLMPSSLVDIARALGHCIFVPLLSIPRVHIGCALILVHVLQQNAAHDQTRCPIPGLDRTLVLGMWRSSPDSIPCHNLKLPTLTKEIQQEEGRYRAISPLGQKLFQSSDCHESL